MKEDRFGRVQTFVGMSILFMLLLSALALGANRPVSWSLLSIGVLVIFSLQVLIAMALPVPLAVRKAMLPVLLFLAAISWAWVQVLPSMPQNLVHPVWSLVPDAPAFISADPGQGRHAVMRLICYAMIFAVMLWTCSKTERASLALKIIAIFSTALGTYGLYAFAAGENVILGDGANRGVVQASFINRNSYATYAVFGALANLAAYLQFAQNDQEGLRGRLERFFSGSWIFALGTLICIGAVSLTQSRAGAGAGLIGLAVFLIAWRGRDQRWNPFMLLLIGGTLLFIGLTSATGLLERLISTDASDARFMVYPAIVTAILDRPFLGHGLGAFHDVFRAYVPPEAAIAEWSRAHSTYLELAFGFGLPAAALFLISQGMIVWRIWRGTRERRNHRSFSCFALGCAAAVAFHSGFDFSLQMPATAALYSAILAMGFAQSFTRKDSENALPPRRVRRLE